MKKISFTTMSFLAIFYVNSIFGQATVANSTNTVSASSYLGSGNNFDVLFKRNIVDAGRIGTTKINLGLNSNAPTNGVAYGSGAGQFSSGTGNSVFIGQNAGKGQSATVTNAGNNNVFIGGNSGVLNSTGFSNSFFGSDAGSKNTTGVHNVYVGASSGSGSSNAANTRNTFVGSWSGIDSNGSNNVYLGTETGKGIIGDYNVILGSYFSAPNSPTPMTGSRNVCIGYQAGFSGTHNDELFINNYSSPEPLIWGNFANKQLKFNSKVGIGGDGNSMAAFQSYPTTAGGVDVSNYQLFVYGGILTEEVRVNLVANWADYVFNENYKLKPLSEVEQFITLHKHLPNVPSAKQVKEEGIELGDMARIQQEKIEELTLYLIQQNKEIELLKEQNKEISNLKAQIQLLLEKK